MATGNSPDTEKPWWGGPLLVGLAAFLLWIAGPGRTVIEGWLKRQ